MRRERLRELRGKMGLSQEALARQIDIGNLQIWRYENGDNEPSSEILSRLAKALDTSADYLLGLTDDPLPFSVRDILSPDEQAVIEALRQGDKFQAIRIIIG